MNRSQVANYSSVGLQEAGFWLGSLAFIVVLWYLFFHGQLNLIFALILGGTLFLVSLRDKPKAAMLAIAYLILMGDIRRVRDFYFSIPSLDTMLLIAPALSGVIGIPLLLRLKLNDGLSKGMFALTVVMVLEIFNPKQGGLSVGMAGAIFYLAPVLWFWIARRFATERVVEALIYKVLFPLALLSLMLGFIQTTIGFLPFEQAWIDVASRTYTSLRVGGSVRPFGFSVSAAEYATLLGFAVPATAATWWGGRRRIWALAAPFFLAGVLLASGRTVVVKMIFALVVVYAMRRGTKLNAVALLRLSILSLVGLIGINLIAVRYLSSDESSSTGVGGKPSAAEEAIAHQASGFAHPLDRKYSTAGAHGGMFLAGVMQGITSPAGQGLGVTTAAAAKFGIAAAGENSEIDISDMFLCLGLAGGLIYIYIFLTTMRYAFTYTTQVPLGIGLPVLAILSATVGSWLIGAQYSTATIIFFIIGALVNKHNEVATTEAALAAAARRTAQSQLQPQVA